MPIRRILALSVILFLVFFTAGAGITEEVSQPRARTVAQNWLYHLIESHRFGNSEFISPEVKIIGEEVMVYQDKVVGYNFILSPKGHIVVPFRDELPPVKLYSDTTTLRMAGNSDVAEWIKEELFNLHEDLDSRKQELAGIDFSSTRNGKLWALFDVDSSSFPSEYMAATSGAESLSIGPLLTTTWDQGDPYNQYCPLWYTGERTVTGCVATAAAQIMKYWNYPASGQGSTSYTWNNGSTDQTLSRDFSLSTYQWGLMKNNHTSGDTPAEKDAVARLMVDIGYAFHMNYGISSQGGSGAATLDGVNVFQTYFKYKNTISSVLRTSYASDSAWMQVFKNEVQNNRVSQLRIRDPNAGGHSIVVDGYRDSPSEQIHLNMGWSGSYNGWYTPSNIAGGGFVFSDVSYQGAVIGIEPASVPPQPTGAYRMNPNATYSYIADADQFISSWVGSADDGYFDLSLSGFDFQFYGTSVTSVRISTNGYITFGTSGAEPTNAAIPNVNLPNAIIAPFWDDLNATGLASPPGVWWKFYGVAPNRYLVIEWYQVPSWEHGSETYSFEVVLYESSDKIKFQYLDVDSGTNHDFGASATVGIENFAGSSGVQFSYNTASLSNGKAIEFTPVLSGIVDFNGDGKTDIPWRHKTSGQNAVWLMNGTTWSSTASLPGVADTNWGIGGAGDFNNDGKTDILWRHKTSGQDAVWLMNGTTWSSTVSLPGVADTNWEIVGAGDFNNDGRVDILWRHKTDGRNSVWLMNGTTWSSTVSLPGVADANWEIVGP
jgi:hypothetical protein